MLPTTWFETRVTLEQIRENFAQGQKEIRIACGFFTLKGWGLIKSYTNKKKVFILVGIDEPGEERARAALIKEIMRHLALGRDLERRQNVIDLVKRIEEKELNIVDARASSHHGKLYIVDKNIAIVGSANTTGRGFLDQIEAGALYAPSVIDKFISEHENLYELSQVQLLYQLIESQVANYVKYFDDYFRNAHDITQELLNLLREWLKFSLPWDIYLKTILALEQIPTVKNDYAKKPVSYQQDMIAEALRQIRGYGGSMLVASTGLGKTVMGTHIAIQLQSEGLINNVIVICPRPVRKIWNEEMHDAGIHEDCFTLHTLDLSNAKDIQKWKFIIQRISQDGGKYLLILDESHQLRNRYPHEFKNRKKNKKERLAFTRINELVNKYGNQEKVKVLLLSGSPYATDIDNINTQLALLPHTSIINNSLPLFRDNQGFSEFSFSDYEPNSWKINFSGDFFNLPVTHQLTTPIVVKHYGKRDEYGNYIEFGNTKKYFPNIILYSLQIPLSFEDDMTKIISEGYFDLDTKTYKKNIETQVKISWGSSEFALKEFLQRVIDTPGGLNQLDFATKGKANFLCERTEREKVLKPIIKKIENQTYKDDSKLNSLLIILRLHCFQNKEKVIIFCERYPTAFYLEQALKELIPDLLIFCSVEKINYNPNKYDLKQDQKIEEAIASFAPVANKSIEKKHNSYDVFIATDAFGIGVNMQDASVVINYDLAWTPIQPIQRAGRVLRPWDSPRTIKVYTLIPKLKNNTDLKYELLNMERRWDNLMIRHDESRKFIDLPILTDHSQQEINMPDFASDVSIKSGSLTLDSADDDEISGYYKHTMKLHPNRLYAENLLNRELISAKEYNGQSVAVYLLVKYEEKYYTLLYYEGKENVHIPSSEEILELIACNPDTQPAIVNPLNVEKLSDKCLEIWCQKNGINENEILRECTLYLKPIEKDDSIQSLFVEN